MKVTSIETLHCDAGWRNYHFLSRTSRNQRGDRGRCRMRRVEAANPSLTVGAPNLAPEFSATFGANFMM